jgi:hyperosmotically inducible protein
MRIALIVIGMLVVLAGSGCEGRNVADSAITAKVKSKLVMDTETSALRINVDTSGSVVTLSGVAPSLAEKTQAEQIAKNTEGVIRVVNNIVVERAPAGGSKNEGKASEGKPEDAIRNVEDGANNTGIMAADLTILSKIKARYISEGIVGANIDVKDGAVTLSGEVNDIQNRVRAESIARATSGVKSVDNRIVVRE